MEEHDLDCEESISELMDFDIADFLCNVRWVQNEYNSSHNQIFANDMKAIASFCRENLNKAAPGCIFRSTFYFGPWYMVFTKEVKLAQHSDE